jgi:tRNA threonylcarbamoyl adenosine modification protein YeaZ
MELALDSSTDTASLALSRHGEVQAEFSWLSEQNHTVEMMPNLLHLLAQARIQLSDLEAVVVAKGPGSFNGVRVGVATAKALAFILTIPLVGISTLEVEAFPYAATGKPVCPVQNAGRGEIATARYQLQNGVWQCSVAEHITTVEELCASISGEAIFCGRFSDDIAQRITGLLGDRAIVSHGLRRAGFLAELGWRRLQENDTDDPTALQPMYLRPPSVTTPRKREVRR